LEKALNQGTKVDWVSLLPFIKLVATLGYFHSKAASRLRLVGATVIELK
jgi:hypothetical protein